MVKDLIDKTKKYIVKLAKEKRTPHQTAIGFAIGTFVAILPSPGVNILFCVIAALIYRKINKLTLFGALAFWNTLLMIPIWVLGAKIGKFIVGDYSGEFKIHALNRLSDYILNNFPTTFNINSLLSKAFDIGVDVWVGTAILAVGISITSYFVVKYIAVKHSEHSFFKHLRNMHKIVTKDHNKADKFEKKIRRILNKDDKNKNPGNDNKDSNNAKPSKKKESEKRQANKNKQ